MEYSALLFKKIDSIDLFIKDEDCKQIVLCCTGDELLEFSMHPFPKTMLVKKSDKPYVALLSGLKAVSQENVLVVRDEVKQENIDLVKKELAEYPEIYYDMNLQGFDTRMVMFCLQVAIESNLAIDTYAKAVEMLASTPIKYL